MSTGILVFAHGSRLEPANEAVRAVAAQLAARLPEARVQAAFLELGQPGLPEAAIAMADSGITSVIIAPYFLTPGLHLDRDLPMLVDEIRRARPHLDVRVTSSLDSHPALAGILLDRVRSHLEDQPDTDLPGTAR